MNEPADSLDPSTTPQQLGEALAARLGDKDWVLDLATDEPQENTKSTEGDSEFHIPNSELHEEVPLAEAASESEVPPSPLQIIEAMLFIGGQPLQVDKACRIVRGLSADQFREAIDVLNRVYRLQNRPYHVVATEQGYALKVRPRYKSIKERIFGGPARHA